MENSFSFTLKIFTVILLGLWVLYWLIKANMADKEKPKLKSKTIQTYIEIITHFLAGLFLLTQLFVLTVFQFRENHVIGLLGLGVIIMGITISISARISLGANWTGASEYQIKKEHELVTKGIYQYIRHPIYLAVILVFTGVLIVAQSYLFIPFFFIVMFWSFSRGKREEKILIKKFGKEYKEYQKNSHMLFPCLF